MGKTDTGQKCRVDIFLKAEARFYLAKMVFVDQKGKTHEWQLHGKQDATAESNLLTALQAGLEILNRPCLLEIHTGSDYLTGPLKMGWLWNWKNNDWRNRKGKQIRNMEQWRQIDRLLASHAVRIVKEEYGNEKPYDAKTGTGE